MIKTINISEIAKQSSVDFSICSLVTNKSQYDEMVSSFVSKGFDEINSEFLYIENSKKNYYDGFSGLNLFLRSARGKYILLCHQDILLHDHDISQLRKKIAELNQLDKNWALAGNAGCSGPGILHIRITDPNGTNTRIGTFPAKVQSLDENFIIAKADANLSLSRDLKGFHLYGADLCLIADILGYNSYVIDFHLHHIGGNSVKRSHKLSDELYASCVDFSTKYNNVLRSRWIGTTCTNFYISGSAILQKIFNKKAIKKYLIKRKKCS